MTIPGTHDSGSYNMTATLIGVPEFLDEIIKVADELGLPVGDIIDAWSKSQDQDLFGQFCGGIRSYVRPSYYFVHPSSPIDFHPLPSCLLSMTFNVMIPRRLA